MLDLCNLIFPQSDMRYIKKHGFLSNQSCVCLLKVIAGIAIVVPIGRNHLPQLQIVNIILSVHWAISIFPS